MRQQRVVSHAREMQFVSEVGSDTRRDPERDNAAALSYSAFEQTVVGAAACQVAGDTANGRFGPAPRGLAVIDAALYECTRIFIRNFRVSAFVATPVHLPNKIAKNRVGSADEQQHELADLTGRQALQKPLQMVSRCSFSHEVPRAKALDDDVPKASRRDGRESTRFQRLLE